MVSTPRAAPAAPAVTPGITGPAARAEPVPASVSAARPRSLQAVATAATAPTGKRVATSTALVAVTLAPPVQGVRAGVAALTVTEPQVPTVLPARRQGSGVVD